MKTVREKEIEAILKLGETIDHLQKQLNEALDRIQELEKQLYGSR
jgi:hypothetical protein